MPGRPLDDIRSALDSRAAGECIRTVVHTLARDPATELHCSLAGGRKTMSALLATALQLYGRPQDRLYHVLVIEPFEHVPDFLYPPRRRVSYRVDGRSVSTRQARVVLVEIPFVALGTVARRLGYEQLDLEALAAELEAEVTGRLRPDALLVDLEARWVLIGDRPVHLPRGNWPFTRSTPRRGARVAVRTAARATPGSSGMFVQSEEFIRAHGGRTLRYR
jgi:hypothetical protein